MKKVITGIALAISALLIISLTNFGSVPVGATPSMGSNCAGCHGSNIPGAKPAPKPTTPAKKPATTTKKPTAPAKTTQPAKPAAKPEAAKPAPAAAGKCAKCHATVSPLAGVGCETCHEGGAAHMSAPTKVKVKFSKQGAQICASCHAHVGKKG